MRHDRLLILGGLMSAMIAAGCGSSSPAPTDGASGKGGSGGGSGGSGMDAGLDHGSLPDVGADTSGSGGKMDANLDGAQDHTTGAGGTGAGGSNDAAGDTVADAPMDTATDTAPQDAGPCVTNYGAGNQVLFAFNGGATNGWYTFVQEPNTTGLTASPGFSFTEGRSCPGSMAMGANFTAYGTGVAGFIETFFGTSPGGANWTGYKALHAWIKAESATLSELNGVYFYVKSGNQVFYQNDFAAGANLADWQQVVIDLTRAPNGGNGVMINDVQLMGFEALLNTAPGLGAPATPSPLELLVDDIWLEAAPPVDSGTSDAHATDGSGQ